MFINTMSYHAPHDCSIDVWKRDGFILSELWGLPKDQNPNSYRRDNQNPYNYTP